MARNHNISYAENYYGGNAYTPNYNKDTRAPRGVRLSHVTVLEYTGANAPIVNSLVNISASASGTAATPLVLGGATATNGVATTDPTTSFLSRCVSIASAGNDSANTFLITGTGKYGNAQSELLTGANIGTATTKKAFKTVTSIVPTSNTAAAVTVGWSKTFGLIHPVTAKGSVTVKFDGAMDTGTLVVGDATSPVTTTTGDTCGTIALAGTPDGAKELVFIFFNVDHTAPEKAFGLI